LMRFSAGYIVGRLDLDEQQLHDVEPRPAADPEVEDAVAS